MLRVMQLRCAARNRVARRATLMGHRRLIFVAFSHYADSEVERLGQLAKRSERRRACPGAKRSTHGRLVLSDSLPNARHGFALLVQLERDAPLERLDDSATAFGRHIALAFHALPLPPRCCLHVAWLPHRRCPHLQRLAGDSSQGSSRSSNRPSRCPVHSHHHRRELAQRTRSHLRRHHARTHSHGSHGWRAIHRYCMTCASTSRVRPRRRSRSWTRSEARSMPHIGHGRGRHSRPNLARHSRQ